jgi:hypothetical protein
LAYEATFPDVSTPPPASQFPYHDDSVPPSPPITEPAFSHDPIPPPIATEPAFPNVSIQATTRAPKFAFLDDPETLAPPQSDQPTVPDDSSPTEPLGEVPAFPKVSVVSAPITLPVNDPQPLAVPIVVAPPAQEQKLPDVSRPKAPLAKAPSVTESRPLNLPIPIPKKDLEPAIPSGSHSVGPPVDAPQLADIEVAPRSPGDESSLPSVSVAATQPAAAPITPAATNRPPYFIPMIVGGVLLLASMAGAIVWGLTADKQKSVAKKPAEISEPETWEQEVGDVNPFIAEATPEADKDANPPIEFVFPMPIGQPMDLAVPPAESQPEVPAEMPPEAAPAAEPSAAPAPTPAATTKPADVRPFAGFAAQLTLPEVVADKKTKLGPVNIPDEALCQLALFGSAIASSDHHEFSLRPTKNSDRSWEVLGKGATDDQPEVIARLDVTNRELWLTWTDDAPDNPATPALMNCALEISSDREVHRFALRQTTVIDPLPIAYQKKEYFWELPSLPQNKFISVELSVAAPPNVPQPRFLGSATVPVSNGQSLVELGGGAGNQFLKLQIKTRLDARGVYVDVMPWVQVTGQRSPIALTEKNVARVNQSLAASAAQVDAELTSLQPPMPKSDPDAETRNQLNGQLAAIRTSQGELNRLFALRSSVETQGQIKLKVVYAGEGVAVDLLRTK